MKRAVGSLERNGSVFIRDFLVTPRSGDLTRTRFGGHAEEAFTVAGQLRDLTGFAGLRAPAGSGRQAGA